MTPWFDYNKERPEKNWSYCRISKNPNISWSTVCENPDWPWDYVGLSANLIITWDIVKENPDIDWNYIQLSDNPMTAHPYFTKNLSYILK